MNHLLILDKIKIDFEHDSMAIRTNKKMLPFKDEEWTIFEMNRFGFSEDMIFAYPSQVENPNREDIWCFHKLAVTKIIEDFENN